MPLASLTRLEDAIRSSWSADVDGARLEHQYRTLAARVDAALAADEFPRNRPSRLA